MYASCYILTYWVCILFISHASKITLQLEVRHIYNMIQKGIEIRQIATYSM